MQRLFSTVQPLAAGTTLTGAWTAIPVNFSVATPLSMAAGSSSADFAFLTVSASSDQPGLLIIQQTDDPSNGNLSETVVTLSVVGNSIIPLSVPSIGIRKLYWRYIYQNTGSAQNRFEFVINGFNTPAQSIDPFGNARVSAYDPMYTGI